MPLFHSVAVLSLVVGSLCSTPLLQARELPPVSSFVKRDSVPAEYVAAPYYPTPKGGWVSEWTESYSKAQAVVSNMTLAEKVNLTSGTGYFMERCTGNTGSAERFGIPMLCLADSALGVKDTQNNTAFPAGITTGATFNKDLMYARGAALGAEARGKGVNIQLGPTVGPLGRKPRAGRNWEGFGADPVLQAIGGAQTVKGMQENGVIATIKHLIGNEQEEWRMRSIPSGLYMPLSSNLDDRTLHELYLWPFAEAIRAGVGAVMTSYNEVNGSAASQNSMLINGILKDELGFQGLVMCDWLSQDSGVASALSGLDMAMPGDGDIPLLGEAYWAYELSTAVLNGTVPLDRLNDMVTRIVATWYQMGQDQDYPEPNFSVNTADATGECYPGALLSPTCETNEYVDVEDDHSTVVREIAREGIVMLKNDNATLPLQTNISLYVFGSDAQVNPDGANACSNKACDTGTLGMGWGSGTANYPYFDDPITALKANVSNLTYYSSDTYPTSLSPTPSDIAIVFINSNSGEESFTVEGNIGDRNSAGLSAWHDGDALVQAAAAQFSTVIVVVHTVGPILVEPWYNLTSVKSILVAHLPGQEAGSSLTDILFGTYSPSGHLPYSIPVSESDYPDSLSLIELELGQVQDTFSEGLYIDYRYLNKQNIAPRYAFGHGLSYTIFSFTDATITATTPLTERPPARAAKTTSTIPSYNTSIPDPSEVAYPTGFTKIWRYLYPYLDDTSSAAAKNGSYPYPTGYSTTPQPDPVAGGSQGGNPALWDTMYNISVKVTNTGSTYSGKGVAMLFVSYPNNTNYDTPVIQLRDFAKTGVLTPGESEVVGLGLTRKDVSVWDVEAQNWVVPGVGDDGTAGFGFWVGSGSGELAEGVVCEGVGLTCKAADSSPVVT